MKKAFVTGITGQDGSYLAELLIERGYRVYGLVRRSSSLNTSRIDHIRRVADTADSPVELVYGDLTDASGVAALLHDIAPDEVYNLGAQSHVRVSYDIPEYTGEISGMGSVRLLEAIRRLDLKTRFYQASSSELYGKVHEVPQKETTPFHPRSPYAAAKAYAFYITLNYREAYGMFAVNGILFNHESPRRGETFVTRKITRGATRIKVGLQQKLYLGNLEAKRDWGFAGDYVEGMWRMLQAPEPDDFVLATGETHSVREFAEKVFASLDLDYKQYVEYDAKYERPAEVDLLLGDYTKAKTKLGWEPKVSFDELVKMMVESDLVLAKEEKAVAEHKELVGRGKD